MHVISLKALRSFWERHLAAESPLRHWHSIVEKTAFADFNELRRTFPNADYVRPYTVFNVGGNNFRLVAAVHYEAQRVYVRWVLTHSEYDRWSKQQRRPS